MESRDRDRLDHWLDEALRQNATAEPRPGLEGRVLARIAQESERHRTWNSWAWIWATATVAAMVLLIGFAVRHDAGKAPRRAVPVVSRNSAAAGVAHRAAPVSLAPLARRRSHRKLNPAVAAKIDGPRREHFPSRRPLSEKELVLASYAQQFPAEASRIAGEQLKFEQEIAKAQEEAEKASSGAN